MYPSKVEICGINTAKIKVLKEKEKMELLKKMNNGNKHAREELINGNLRLVLSVVGKFNQRGENPDDLFQVGCIGLMKAIDNFDTSLNVRFSTYAVPMIIGEIKRYLRDNTAMRVSRSLRDTAYKAMQTKERLTAKLDREPTIEEIAGEMGLEKQEVVIALEAIVEPASLFDSAYNDGGDTIFIMDQVADKQNDGDWLDELQMKDSIEALNQREKNILALRFLGGMTQMEVASRVGISQAQVSRLEKNALNRIKESLGAS